MNPATAAGDPIDANNAVVSAKALARVFGGPVTATATGLASRLASPTLWVNSATRSRRWNKPPSSARANSSTNADARAIGIAG